MKRPAASDDDRKRSTRIPVLMMAPCGMNCGVCAKHLRDRDPCLGCLAIDRKLNHCEVGIKVCTERNAGATFCFDCAKYPCRRLRQLDLRYRTKYGMSMLENLDRIRELGLERFMAIENTRWVCPACGNPICVHDRRCYTCGAQYERTGGETD
ncbi:MAG: DUF3795 domain-containing protein [Candidatus Cryosericum sp.]